MGKFIDLSGQRFGKLTVLDRAENRGRRTYWRCSCDCGKIIERESSTITQNKSSRKSCGCLRREIAQENGIANLKFGEESSQWKGLSGIPKNYINGLEFGARARGFEFSITLEDIVDCYEKQSKRCYYTAQEVSFEKSRFKKIDPTASVDRIDSSKGYTKDNIRIVHKDVNLMKNHFEESYFISICKKISSLHG